MINLAKIGLEILAKGFAFLAALFWAYNKGQDAEKLKESQADQEASREANKIHNRIDTDAAYRKRVRDAFDG